MSSPIARVVRRFKAFKYVPKEKKKTKVERIWRFIREHTGLSKNQAEDIADAIVRGRNIQALTHQKGWPIKDDIIEGPSGKLNLKEVYDQT